eukprot:scaffold52944_cov68-Phaeocystis_antarctica.AAC.2
MGADAAARTKRPRYEGVQLSAAACTARIGALLEDTSACSLTRSRSGPIRAPQFLVATTGVPESMPWASHPQ